MQDRATYDEIKNWVLSLYWDDCLTYGPISNKDPRTNAHPNVTSISYDAFASGSGSFGTILEYLMLEVICLVMCYWYPEDVAYHTRQINEYLANNSLAEMLKDIPKEEADDFLSDLRILGFLEKGTVLSPTITVP